MSALVLEALKAESRRLIARSARLCGRARRIRGGSGDVDAPFIVETISRVPMCLECVARKNGITEERAQESLQRIRSFMVVDVSSGPCGGCLRLAMIYRIANGASGPDGAVATRPDRPVTVTQGEALWRFLTSHRGEMFCTQCIANALFATKRIDRAVIGAEGRGARRQYGVCASCRKERLLCGLPA
jgi:hypothetical protein